MKGKFRPLLFPLKTPMPDLRHSRPGISEPESEYWNLGASQILRRSDPGAACAGRQESERTVLPDDYDSSSSR
jgi:hypothetical protein